MAVSDLILISVGNSRSRIAHARLTGTTTAGDLQPATVFGSGDTQAMVDHIVKLADALDVELSRVVVATVNEAASKALLEKLAKLPGLPSAVKLTFTGAGDELATGLKIPLAVDLDAAATPGADRLLCALAAHDRSRSACVVIDVGTAVTVDLVGRFGTFAGGVIAPGLGAMLGALHSTASALPKIESPKSAQEDAPAAALGKNTRDAMLIGCIEAIRGLCYRMIDRYAEIEGSYPRIIATGGDAGLLFREDELIEHIVPDLVLIGMQTAWIRSEFPGSFEQQQIAADEEAEVPEGEENELDFGDESSNDEDAGDDGDKDTEKDKGEADARP